SASAGDARPVSIITASQLSQANAVLTAPSRWESNFAAGVIGSPQVGHSSRPNLSNMGFPPARSNRRRGGWFHKPVIRGPFAAMHCRDLLYSAWSWVWGHRDGAAGG